MLRPVVWLITVLCLVGAGLFAAPGSAAADAPSSRHIDLKLLMLELINDARGAAGVPDVRLGSNDAAQLHAEAMAAGCFMSHWDRSGLKPYMRYSLQGGYQSNAENVAAMGRLPRGGDPCAPAVSAVPPDLDTLVRRVMDSWLLSHGHRENLLRPQHRLVNIGIAWRGGEDAYLFRAVQHFEGEYVRFERPPTIVEGVLTLSGRLINGAALAPNSSVKLSYDPPPPLLTLAQLSVASSSCTGYPVAAVFASSGWTVRSSTPGCVEPSLGVPVSDGRWVDVPVVVASTWETDGASFEIRADLSPILRDWGAGVYTVSLRGELADGGRAKLTKYAAFHGAYPLLQVFAYRGPPVGAADLLRSRDLRAVFRWSNAEWEGYAEHQGAPIPGAADFPISTGDYLWLTP